MGGVIPGTAFTREIPILNTTSGNGNSTLEVLVVINYNIGCRAGSLFTMVIGEWLNWELTVVGGATVLALGIVIRCSPSSIAQLIVFPIPAHSNLEGLLIESLSWSYCHWNRKWNHHFDDSGVAC